MNLFASKEEVPEAEVAMRTTEGSLSTSQVFGIHVSLMTARRSGGYHSVPHSHDCEQLNLVTDGDIWIFIEEAAFHLHPGDYLRIPPSRIHWAWNRSTSDCVLLEAHSPGLDILPVESTPFLLDNQEPSDSVQKVKMEWFPDYPIETAEQVVAPDGTP